MDEKSRTTIRYLAMSILVSITLTACGSGGLAYETNGWMCQEGICLKLDVVEPILNGEPIVLVVTVTSDHDVPEIYGNVKSFGRQATIDPGTWLDEYDDVVVSAGNSTATWKFSLEEDIPYTVMRPFQYTPRVGYRVGYYDFSARVSIMNEMDISTTITIYMNETGGTAYRSGTPVPDDLPVPYYTVDPIFYGTVTARAIERSLPTLTPPP
ncbi:MAG: hypothetical protein L0Z70_06865, partial [Chloroflexi bacterium]|nr:hypothetical protein [Chloroflexota bacterium]